MDLTFLFELEKKLHQQNVRSNGEALEALLHQEFSEIGASGRYWSREAIIKSLLNEKFSEITAYNFAVKEIGTDVAQVTYETKSNPGNVLRSSLWKRNSKGWQLFFHQGTPKN